MPSRIERHASARASFELNGYGIYASTSKVIYREIIRSCGWDAGWFLRG